MSGSVKVRRVAAAGGLCAIAMTPQWACGQDGSASAWQVEGSTRVRYEAIGGDFRPGSRRSDDVVSFRTSLEIRYERAGLRAGLEVRDARAYGIDASTPLGTGDVNAVELAQAYVGADLAEDISLTAGRFLLNLGSKRLAGDPVFRNGANSFTGLRLDWRESKDNQLTVFYTLPDIRLPSDRAGLSHNHVTLDEERFDLRFWGVFAARKLGDVKAEAYVFGLDEDDYPDHPTRNRHLITFGTRLRGSPAPRLAGEVEVMVQRGTIRTSKAQGAPRVPVHAYAMHAELAYAFPGRWKPRLTAFADAASGDKGGTRAWERFDNLYGPRREWNPTSLYGPLGLANVRDVGLRFDAAPSARLDGYVEWRRLGLASATDAFAWTRVADPAGLSGRDAGTQYQARVRYWLVPKTLQLEWGAALLDKGPFLRGAPNAPDHGNTRYGYMSAMLSF